MTSPNDFQRNYWRTRQAWVERQQQMDLQLNSFGIAAMEALGDISGANVLDVGCGCGHTTLQLHERVGDGHVLGIDISETLLEVARTRSRGSVEFLEADAQVDALRGPYDAVYSRFGVMFFADSVAAFTNLRASTITSGQLSFVCWQGPEENPWITVPNRAGMALVDLPPRAPQAADPFAFSNPGAVERILSEAGWKGIEIQSFQMEVPLGGGVDVRSAALHAFEFSPVKAALDSAPTVESDDVIDVIVKALAPHEQNGIVRLPGAVWVVTAQN